MKNRSPAKAFPVNSTAGSKIGPSSGSAFVVARRKSSFEFSGSVYYDGGVVEISNDNGASWSDIGAAATPGYTGTIVGGGANPLEGRSAWTATSAGYPAMSSVTINLGTSRAGQTVRVRFRVGTDVGVGAPGWELRPLLIPLPRAYKPALEAYYLR